MAFDKSCVYLCGWKPGFNKVAFTALMQEEVGVGLKAAKNLTDRLLAGETVIVWVRNLSSTLDQARSLGAIVLDYPRVQITFKKKPGIVAYLTAGDPDLQTTLSIALAAIDNGADVIELGVPFSDPLADGPVIQRASERAVGRGVRLADVLETARQLRAARPACGIVIFSYLNPVVRMGMKQFCAAAKAAGADGVLLTDMIVEEADEYLEEMRANELAPVFLAAPTSPDVRLKAIAEASRGFVYAISRVGITGTQQKVAGDASELVRRLRVFTEPLGIPIAVGFGISNAEHVRAVGEFADAAVIGSALVALIEKTAPAEAAATVGQFIKGLRA